MFSLSEKHPAFQPKFGIKSYFKISDGTWKQSLYSVGDPVKQECRFTFNIPVFRHFRKFFSD